MLKNYSVNLVMGVKTTFRNSTSAQYAKPWLNVIPDAFFTTSPFRLANIAQNSTKFSEQIMRSFSWGISKKQIESKNCKLVSGFND
ncbi:MAG: hypothetical protein EAZ32_19570 [Cytophagia bacterium]|nr:MAG: hypothetical protein EAZ38_02200 [Cytophagales bacterium]TAG34540.1 MAG: hypothetical protein EAZ32_19570 [Cytophagia bacterium]TAG76685.1 MAG: hypothetical protein EAZ22_17415 [Cytophagales bacterium]